MLHGDVRHARVDSRYRPGHKAQVGEYLRVKIKQTVPGQLLECPYADDFRYAPLLHDGIRTGGICTVFNGSSATGPAAWDLQPLSAHRSESAPPPRHRLQSVRR